MKKWLDKYENGGLVSKKSLNRKVTCSNCGWSWKLSDGGEDPLTCHKCGGTIKMKNGGELDEYKEKGEVVNPNNPIQLPNVNFVYKRPVVESTFDAYQQNTPIVDRGNFSNIPYRKSDQIAMERQNATNKKIAQQELQQELSAKKAKEKGTAFTLPTGATKKYKDMNVKERLYVDAQVLKNKGRWNENQVEQPFLNNFNPITMLYDMGAGLGEAPLMSDVTNSYIPYVTGVAAPLTAGALAGIGANTTGQFVNELINPLAGIRNPFKNKKFKSEINWRNWNKEIPKNVPLMQEYNAIEQTTKANGTWMKNFDGSKFKGTPEQFVQQNSENFKKAFGKDFNTGYRGQRIPTNIMDGGNYPSGITFLGDKDQAMTYGETWKKSHSGKIYQPGMFDPKEPALYELIYPNSNNKKIITHSNVRDWRELTDDEVASQLKKVDLKRRGLSNKGEQFITTDDVAYFVKRNDLDYAYIPKIRDYGRKPDRRFFNLLPGKSVGNTVIVNSKPGNYLKSRWYNNGMFDMTNPDIYKAIVPAAIGVGALQENKYGGQWLDKYKEKGEVVNPNNPIQLPNVNFVYKRPVANSTFNPYENVNRVGTSDNTKVFRLNPEQVEKVKEAAAIRNEKIIREYYQNNQSFIGPDNRTKAERDRSIAARKAYDDLMEKQQVMSQQPFYQTLQNTTAGGYNPNAAYNPVIGKTAEGLGYMAAGALGSSAVRPAFNFMGEAMNLPIQGVPGFTGSNIVNAAFTTHGLKSIMDGSVTKPWKEAYRSGNPWDYANAVSENAMTALELAPLVGPTYRGIALEAGNVYNNIATGNSIIPYAWKSPAVGLSQGASDVMFKGLLNSNKLTDAERALIVEYQYDSKPFTGRGILPVNQEKKEALNNIIKKYNLNVNNNSIFTRRFNPEDRSLGADFINNNLNLRDRPSSFSAGVGDVGYRNSMDRLVIPNRYAKNMGNNFLANEYGAFSDDAINLVDPKVKNFASDIGKTNTRINAEREVIGTGLNFKRIGKVKNDIGGYDHIVKPINANGNLIWEKPNAKQLVQEYNVEHELKNLNLFKNKDEFINAVKNAKEEEITKGIDNLISNRSRTTSKKDLLSLIMTYKSYPKYRNEKTIEDIYTTLNLGGKMDMPIILEYPNGERKVFSGNTRMDLSFQSGINPKALIIKVPIKKQEGGAIITNRGQWDYPGQTTIIPSNEITMEGVPYPVLGVDNTGYVQMMQPQMNYTFPGQYVTEYPMMQYGGLTKYKEKGEVKNTKTTPVVKKPVYQYTPQNFVQPSFNNIPRNVSYAEVPFINTDDIESQIYTNDQSKRGLEFHKKWMSSPMYKQMLYNSDPVNAKAIEKNRWDNYNKVKLTYNPVQPHDHPLWGASSNSSTGKIQFYPHGVEENVSNTGPHEISHSIDIDETGKNKKRNLPGKDMLKMYLYSNAVKTKQGTLNKLAEWKYKNDPDFYNYVAKPTETRARLNDIRQKAYENKLYDPFTQKVDANTFNKLLKFKFEKKQGWDPLWQLQNVYTNDQIIDLLNTVSKNNKVPLNPQIMDNNNEWEIIG